MSGHAGPDPQPAPEQSAAPQAPVAPVPAPPRAAQENNPAVLPVDLNALLLPADWTLEQLEEEARRIYFEDLVPSPPETPRFTWLERRTLIVPPSEGGFAKVFGLSVGWAQYQHKKTGDLDVKRLRRVRWIRPVLEMRVPKTRIYVNNHSMRAREFGPNAVSEKKRVFITLSKGLSYFISLVYTKHGLALGTAFEPDGEWLRKQIAKSTLLGP
ncbi:MAG TPA: hypothetical protein VFE51_11055 [Verrucomicrobiae bacterium]|nr:hypothetical protein [Verrucomicrobiae bacterium]